MIVVVIALAWLVLAIAAALLVGGSIRIADRRAPLWDHEGNLPADLTVDLILGYRPAQPTSH